MKTSYSIVSEFYEGKSAARSGVPYMAHVDEGVKILKAISATDDAIGGYCLHPLVQSNVDFLASIEDGTLHNKLVSSAYMPHVLLAVEYRNIANAFLSNKAYTLADAEYANIKQALNDNSDLRDMLIADKVQNRKDFEIYHINTHPRATELDFYFKRWLNELLGISEQQYTSLINMLAKESNENYI